MAALRGPTMDLADWQNTETPTLPANAGHGNQSYSGQEPMTDQRCLEDDAVPLLEALTRAIESEVIPRMLQARREANFRQANPVRENWVPTAEALESFVGLTLHHNEQLALDYVQDLLDRGVVLETVYSALLGRAAQRLGVLWDDDTINFTHVTTAVWRMQQIMRTLSAAYAATIKTGEGSPRILLVSAIGSQHSFGLAMVSEFFRRAGWIVTCELPYSDDELAALVRQDWFDVIGFSAGSMDLMATLTRSIAITRRASRNLKLGVMVGGPAFVAQPGLVATVGADATAADAAGATIAAEKLMALLARTV